MSFQTQRVLVVVGIVIAVVLAVTAFYMLFQYPGGEAPMTGSVQGVATKAPDSYEQISLDLAGVLNDLSPTPPSSVVGWLLMKVSFVQGRPWAYLEYTDTHLALRALVEYTYHADQIKAKILATFEPQETGGFSLTHGIDSAAGLPTMSWIAEGPGHFVLEAN